MWRCWCVGESVPASGVAAALHRTAVTYNTEASGFLWYSAHLEWQNCFGTSVPPITTDSPEKVT